MGSVATEKTVESFTESLEDLELECETIDLISKSPMDIFKSWLEEAKSQPHLNILPETMTLCTVREDGGPSARSVLLRGLDEHGFKMYWDKRSPKSKEISLDARGALVFCWHLDNADGTRGLRQARIEGIIENLPEDDNSQYFNEEPLSAKIRATVCHQSRVVTDDRSSLVQDINRLWKAANEKGVQLQKPSYWGGYRLVPTMIEFYKGKRDAINDRVRFRKTNEYSQTDLPEGVSLGEDGWVYERLEP